MRNPGPQKEGTSLFNLNTCFNRHMDFITELWFEVMSDTVNRIISEANTFLGKCLNVRVCGT